MKNVRRFAFVALLLLLLLPDQHAAAQARPSEHVVAQGETLFGIARKYDLSVADLRQLNGLTSTVIHPGQSLKLRAAARSGSDLYVVRAGDTLWSISKRNGVSVETLKSLNGISGSDIKIGQTLRLSAGDNLADASTPEAENKAAVPDPDHVLSGVKKEEESDSNADLDETTESNESTKDLAADDDPKTAGATTDDVVAGGGKDKAPEPDVTIRIDDAAGDASGDYHVVKSGETWQSIASRYGIAADSIRSANGGVAALPQPGERVRIPEDPTVFKYTVEEGDTIDRIARWFTVDASVIRRINNIEGNDVTPGQVLRIPDLNSPLLQPDKKVETKRRGTEKRKDEARPVETPAAKTGSDPAAKAANEPAVNGNELPAKTEDSASTLVDDPAAKDVSERVVESAIEMAAETTDEPTENPETNSKAEASDTRLEVRIYPDSFKGRLMANGNGYNPRRSTISHPTFAYGTQVRVTNLATGASAFAIVADRPLPGKNQVDVSRALAGDLGINNSGDALVMIERVE